ncbi:hypothetical protein GCM10023321_34350 [Pseudonocardia eucalypti]|uniref:EAL domain-containing protein n=1 Tax=Pseudonocardia eucalypti TaxID=648755 RepID=A0ABP9Q7W5_9PSEU|nr:diguanylate cyclase (GGDEF)-like protein/PAS domain S-box-containing protein [Pseudonocardia eucalypti]
MPSQLTDSRPNPVAEVPPDSDEELTGFIAPVTDSPARPAKPAAKAGPAKPVKPAGLLESLALPTAPTLLCDGADRVLRVNAALLRMAGRDPRQPTADDGLIGQPLGKLLAGPDTDARLVRPDGALARVRVVRWALPDLGPGAPGTGPLAGIRAVMLIDLTDVPQSVTNRDDTSRQIAELQRLARVGSWSYDLRTGALHRTPALIELYRELNIVPDGRPGGSIELEQVALLCATLRDAAQREQQPENPDEHHIEHRTAPNGGQTLSCRASVERNAEGTPIRLVGTVQDVSERRQAEQRIGRATQRYLDLVSIAPVGVAVFNRTGHLVDANGSLCTLLGVSGERLRGVSARELSLDPTGTGELAFLRQVPPGARYGYRVPQYAVRRADGTSVWCELSVTVSIGDDGRPFWLVVFTDISAQRRAADVLRRSGTHDDLTRLPNRSSVTATVGRLLAGPDRHKLAVLCCDLDDFKRVNTALGHAAGDQVLVTLATRLQRELPVGCSPARMSGDEFVVVCDDVSAVGGVNRLGETVAALLRGPVEVDGQSMRVSAAIGVATPQDGDGRGGVGSAEDLLRLADAAMYDAKRRGANQLGFVTEDTATSAHHQLRLEDELREAIACDQLELHYQPVVGADGAIRSAEALVRWVHPERGMLYPGEFIPVAERGGLMHELDQWVLRTATREAAAWPAHNRRPVSVALNLAGLLPGDADFLPAVRAALAESGLAGDRLILELVETSLVALPQRTLAAMSELSGLGVRFAVDDFGTGYSSLSRIKELPAQIVKVDRTFVRNISSDPADFAVARAVVQMAAAMGRYCVAEGVETAEQFHALRGLGVDAYQGWLFAKAQEPTAFREMLSAPPMTVPSGEPASPPDGLATQALRTDAARAKMRRAEAARKAGEAKGGSAKDEAKGAEPSRADAAPTTAVRGDAAPATPGRAESAAARVDAAPTTTVRAEVGRAGNTRADAAPAKAVRGEAGRAESGRVDAAPTTAVRAEVGRAESGRVDAAPTMAVRAEKARAESAASRVDAAPTTAVRAEKGRAGAQAAPAVAARAENARNESGRAGSGGAEPARAQAAGTGIARTETARAEPARVVALRTAIDRAEAGQVAPERRAGGGGKRRRPEPDEATRVAPARTETGAARTEAVRAEPGRVGPSRVEPGRGGSDRGEGRRAAAERPELGHQGKRRRPETEGDRPRRAQPEDVTKPRHANPLDTPAAAGPEQPGKGADGVPEPKLDRFTELEEWLASSIAELSDDESTDLPTSKD